MTDEFVHHGSWRGIDIQDTTTIHIHVCFREMNHSGWFIWLKKVRIKQNQYKPIYCRSHMESLSWPVHNRTLRRFRGDEKHSIFSDLRAIRLVVMNLNPGNEFMERLRPVIGGHSQAPYYQKINADSLIQIYSENLVAACSDGCPSAVSGTRYLLRRGTGDTR